METTDDQNRKQELLLWEIIRFAMEDHNPHEGRTPKTFSQLRIEELVLRYTLTYPEWFLDLWRCSSEPENQPAIQAVPFPLWYSARAVPRTIERQREINEELWKMVKQISGPIPSAS